jgi:hypothetical protein
MSSPKQAKIPKGSGIRTSKETGAVYVELEEVIQNELDRI